jgi:hypothetical protein
MVNHLRATYAAAWLLTTVLWSSTALADEPAVYPQTAYPPLVLSASGQTAAVLPCQGWQPPDLPPSDVTCPPAEWPATAPCGLSRDERAAMADCSSGNCQACSAAGLFGLPRDDWMWGCGGWPFQTGPGCCDTWKVGPVWAVTVDGMTLFRDNADLTAIMHQAAFNSQGDPLGAPEVINQFDYGGGARVFAAGTLPRWAEYRLQFGYEGVQEWNASVVFPREVPIPIPGSPADSSEQRRVHYVSSMQSAELNFDQACRSVWQPYAGVRYLKFDDELSDLIDQEAPPPLPAPVPGVVTTTDRLNLFDLDNQLIGFQVGVRRDLWQICRRFTLQGYVNSGVYHNLIKRTNMTSVTTKQVIGDDTDTLDENEGRTDVSNATNMDVAELSDVAYMAEASLTGVCRLNKCVALRGGYQFVWIQGLRLAENAYLGADLPERSLTFQGWHVGVEYRR